MCKADKQFVINLLFRIFGNWTRANKNILLLIQYNLNEFYVN